MNEILKNLKEDQYYVLGVQQRTSKSGNIGYCLFLVAPFDKYSIEHYQQWGYRVVEKYVSNMKDIKVGDFIEIIYGQAFNGNAYIRDLVKVGAAKQ